MSHFTVSVVSHHTKAVLEKKLKPGKKSENLVTPKAFLSFPNCKQPKQRILSRHISSLLPVVQLPVTDTQQSE